MQLGCVNFTSSLILLHKQSLYFWF